MLGFIRSNRKYIFILAALLFGFIIFNYFFNKSTLIIENDGAEKSVYVRGLEEDNKVAEFKLGQNETKKITLKPGEYVVGASSSNELSVYDRSLKRFDKQTVSVKTEPQKGTAPIGQSSSNCNGFVGPELIFFPCTNYSGSVGVIKDGEENDILSSLGDNLFFRDDHGQEENNSPAFLALKKHGEDWLEAGSYGGGLYFRKISDLSDINQPNLSIDKKGGYEGALSSKLVAASQDNETFAFFDKPKSTLQIYENINDKQPDIVDLSGDIGEDGDNIAVDLAISGGYLYVFRSKSTVDNDDDVHTAPINRKENIESKVIVFDINKKAKSNVIDLAKETSVSMLSADPKGEGVAFLSPEGNNRLLLAKSGGLEEIFLQTGDIKGICWDNEGSIYYTTVGKGQIFRYSLADRASFLVYNNHRDSIDSLQCNEKHVSFVLESDTDGVIGQFVHYALVDKISSGLRPESILPIYVDVGPDVVKLSLDNNGYAVKLLSDGDGNGGPDKEQTKQALVDKLNEKGVSTKDIIFNFTY